MNWMEYFANPRGLYIKKAAFEILKERYLQNEPIIERLSGALTTEKDVQAFFKLVGDIYEIAYLKAVEDHREQLAKAGLQARVVTPQSDQS